jgi:hypothetical protein
MTDTDDKTAFLQSRIYAQGWNAARRLLVSGVGDPKTMATLNPHQSEPERTRWNEGFTKAME